MTSTNSTSQEPIFSSLADDPDLAELVALYVDETPARVRELMDAFESHNWEALGVLAHQIKGAAGSYGFHDITPLASKLEEKCRSQEQDGSLLYAFDDLISALYRLKAHRTD